MEFVQGILGQSAQTTIPRTLQVNNIDDLTANLYLSVLQLLIIYVLLLITNIIIVLLE